MEAVKTSKTEENKIQLTEAVKTSKMEEEEKNKIQQTEEEEHNYERYSYTHLYPTITGRELETFELNKPTEPLELNKSSVSVFPVVPNEPLELNQSNKPSNNDLLYVKITKDTMSEEMINELIVNTLGNRVIVYTYPKYETYNFSWCAGLITGSMVIVNQVNQVKQDTKLEKPSFISKIYPYHQHKYTIKFVIEKSFFIEKFPTIMEIIEKDATIEINGKSITFDSEPTESNMLWESIPFYMMCGVAGGAMLYIAKRVL